MSDAIQSEITGPPVMVAIGGRELPLSYPLHALFLYKRLTGDTLFLFTNWQKLDFEENYECWMACLYAGLHQQQRDGSWRAPYSRVELEIMINLSNGPEIHRAMVAALTAWMPKEKKTQPNESAATNPKSETPAMAISDATGSERVNGSASPENNS
jgi:hypothetical protein